MLLKQNLQFNYDDLKLLESLKLKNSGKLSKIQTQYDNNSD